MSKSGDIWTKKGWPRPIIQSWPIPWVSPANELKRTDEKRMTEVVDYALCQVCGLKHDGSESRIFFFINGKLGAEPPSLTGKVLQMMDNACLHKRCMFLAARRCPALRQLRSEQALWLYYAQWKHVKIYDVPEDADIESAGERVLGVAGEYVTRLRWPDDDSK